MWTLQFNWFQSAVKLSIVLPEQVTITESIQYTVYIQLIEQKIQKLSAVNQLTALSHDLSLPLIGRDSMLNTNSVNLWRVVQADLNLQPQSSACWAAQLLSAFQGLHGCESYVRAVQRAIPMQNFTADLKHRMRGVWRDAELVDPNTHNNKLATYHSWFAIPFTSNERMPINVPRYLHLDLSKHVMHNAVDFACVRIL